jgi:hypothetical protein
LKGTAAFLPGFFLRAILPAALVIFIFAATPTFSGHGRLGTVAFEVIFIVFWLILFFPLYLRHQINRIETSGRPATSWIEALIVIGALFLAIFAHVYRILGQNGPTAFTEPMDVLNSYYFSLTVLSTIGFGDISPVTPVAKIFTMLQMVCDLALIGLVVRVLASAARSNRAKAHAR